jgi:hypothetical protein
MSESLVVGLVVSAVWAVGLLALWRARRWVRYHGLHGSYQAMRKGTGQTEWLLTIARSGNRLEVAGQDGERARFRAEIIMSDELPGSGRGHYFREDNPDAFGFLELQVVNSRRILVHETYADPKSFRSVVSGFVWTKIEH